MRKQTHLRMVEAQLKIARRALADIKYNAHPSDKQTLNITTNAFIEINKQNGVLPL